jgi:C1A family cysteine protease
MSSHPAATHGGGLKQDPFDPKDFYYQAQPSTVPPKRINLREDHANLASEVYDQGTTQSCTANATAAAFWYEEKAGRREKVWGSVGPSRLFIYWLARQAWMNDNLDIPDVSDSGSNSRDAVKGIAKVGACSEDDWPWKVEKINDKPVDEAVNKARPHRITSYFRLDPDRPDEDDKKLTTEQKDMIGTKLLENLRKCLAEGFPVAFGFWYYLKDEEMFDESQNPFVLNDPWKSNKKFPRNTFPKDLPENMHFFGKNDDGSWSCPGHSVLAIGYDDNRQQVLCQNSWGPKWGGRDSNGKDNGNGTFWMPYSWITDFAASNDFWTIRTTHTAPDGTPSKSSRMLWQDVHQEILGTA